MPRARYRRAVLVSRYCIPGPWQPSLDGQELGLPVRLHGAHSSSRPHGIAARGFASVPAGTFVGRLRRRPCGKSPPSLPSLPGCAVDSRGETFTRWFCMVSQHTAVAVGVDELRVRLVRLPLPVAADGLAPP